MDENELHLISYPPTELCKPRLSTSLCITDFFHTETVKSVNKFISLLQIAVNTKIHVQLMASDSFVVYIISRKWIECALQS